MRHAGRALPHARRALSLVFALCTSFGALAQTQSPPTLQWENFSSSEARYAVSFPAPSKQSQREDKMPDGQVIVTNFQEVEDGKRYFALWWVKLPKAPRDQAAQERILESAATGASKSVPGSVLLSKRSVSIGGVAGLDYLIDAPGQVQRLRQRVFLRGDSLVQQIYSGPTGSETEADVERFIESLRLLP